MKTFAAFAISISLIAIGIAAPASAADMNGNGPRSMKDRGPSGVPVPAPMPYEENYRYYLGVGAGWSFHASGDIGLTAGGYNGNLPFGDVGTFSGPTSFSIFAGRYITPTLRTELGLDVRSNQQRQRTLSYQARLNSTMDFGGTTGVQPVTNTYDVTRTEDVELRNHTSMLNVYYDMNRGGRFNPYVGAGVGLSYLHFARGSSEAVTCRHGSPHPITSAPAPCWSGTAPAGLPTGPLATSNMNAQSGIGLAAALMAGMTYNMTDRMHLDVGYRLIYQGAKALVTSSSLGTCTGCNGFSGSSVMNIGARVDHEVRTSIRWDLW